MSEVKGTLLTIILVLAVFATVFTAITVAVQNKAKDVSTKIENAGVYATEDEPEAGANTSSRLSYHF